MINKTYRKDLIRWFNSNAFNGIQITTVKDILSEMDELNCDGILKYIMKTSFQGYEFMYEQDILEHNLISIQEIDKFLTQYRKRNKC